MTNEKSTTEASVTSTNNQTAKFTLPMIRSAISTLAFVAIGSLVCWSGVRFFLSDIYSQNQPAQTITICFVVVGAMIMCTGITIFVIKVFIAESLESAVEALLDQKSKPDQED